MAQPFPHRSFHFLVESGLTRLGFTRVQLPLVEREVIRYQEGHSPAETAQLLPGRLRVGECTLERAVMPPDNEFFLWATQVVRGTRVQRRDVQVKLLNEEHAPVMVWTLRNTFPSALQWSPLEAQHSAVLIETLRLAVESVSVQTA